MNEQLTVKRIVILTVPVIGLLAGWFAPTLVELGSERANLLLAAGIVGGCVWAMMVDSRLGFFLFIVVSFFSGILNRLSYSLSPVDFQFLIALPEIGLFLVVGVQLLKSLAAKGTLTLIRSLDMAILAYIALGTLQALNPRIPLSVGLYGFRLNTVPVLAYFMARVCFRRWSHVKQFYRLLLLLSIVYLTYGILQQSGTVPDFERVWIENYSGIAHQLKESINNQTGYYIDENLRVFSIFTVGGEFSYMAAIVGLMIWGGRVYSVSRGEKCLRWLSLALLLCYFSVSLERAAIAMFIVGMMLMRVVRRPSKRLYTRLALLAAAMTVFFLLGGFIFSRISVPDMALRRLVELLNPFAAKTVQGFRFPLWQDTVALIARNPLGYGAGTATYNRAALSSGSLVTMPHNYFLQVGLEFGIIGFLGLFFVIIKLARLQLDYLSLVRNDPRLFDLLRSLLGVHVAFWACGLFSNPVIHTFAILYWFLMGMVPIMPRLYESSDSNG